MRAAILARFSTDNQREASCDDQIRVCTDRATREGFDVVATYRDHAISGTVPVARRPGGAQMLADALADRFDVLLLEGLDRLTRDAVEQEQIVRRLEYRGLRLIGVSDGYDSQSKSRKLQRGVRGLINEIYLDDLRDKVHRALDGLVLRGMLAAGLPYGYRSVPAQDGKRLEVEPAKARWVSYIYSCYAEGWSPQRIAAELNRRQVPAPRGGTWAVSALYGSPKKGCGILNNPVYVGRPVWNRSQWLKDPDTGKRRRIERPAHEWRTTPLPALRIVPDDLWQAARARIGRHAHGAPKRPPRTLFGGLLTCGTCGGAVVAVSQTYYGCAAHKDRGATVCAGVRVSRRALEQTLLAFARDDLLSPAALARLKAHDEETARTEYASRRAGVQQLQARLAKLERNIEHLVDAIAAGGLSAVIKQRLTSTEAECDRLRREIAAREAAANPGRIFDLAQRLQRLLADLPEHLRRKPETAREALRTLFGQTTLIREGEEVVAELSGVYEGILAAVPSGQVIRHMVAGVRLLKANHTIKYRVRIPRRVA